MIRRFDEGINTQHRDAYENHPEYQFKSDLYMAYIVEHIEEYYLKRDDIMTQESLPRFPGFNKVFRSLVRTLMSLGFFNWGHAKAKSLSSYDWYIRERFIPQSKSTIIKNKCALRYLAGQKRMCKMSGMAQRITPQLLNLRSRHQDMHRVLKVALQPWLALVGMRSLIDYTTEYKVGATYFRADRFCRYQHETLRIGEPSDRVLWTGLVDPTMARLFLCMSVSRSSTNDHHR